MRDSVPSGSYSSVCNVLRQGTSRSSLLIESTDSMITNAKHISLTREVSLIYNYIHVRTLKLLDIHKSKQGDTTNINIFFNGKLKKSCSGGIRTHDILLTRRWYLESFGISIIMHNMI